MWATPTENGCAQQADEKVDRFSEAWLALETRELQNKLKEKYSFTLFIQTKENTTYL